MVEQSVNQKIKDCIDNNKNFVLDAGAGSGKTRTLTETLKNLLEWRGKEYMYTGRKIACITYTNVAADEIMSRINDDSRVRVSTIHSFLWSIIGRYQKELRESLIEMNGTLEIGKRVENLAAELEYKDISYVDYRDFRKGKIGHDDVIALSHLMFNTYPKLSRFVADLYPVIFIDEYQDTSEKVIDIILNIVGDRYKCRVIIGLFGDWMQSIYEHGVGNVNPEDRGLERIIKEENHRSSKRVVQVLNKIRGDICGDIYQAPYSNLPGQAKFYYRKQGNSESALRDLKMMLEADSSWGSEMKILALTNRIVAIHSGWETLRSVYSGYAKEDARFAVDNLLSSKDPYSDIYDYIEGILLAYENEDNAELYKIFKNRINIEGYINKFGLFKRDLSKCLSDLWNYCDSGSIEDVCSYILGKDMFPKNPGISRLLREACSEIVCTSKSKGGPFYYLKDCKYSEVRAMKRYKNEMTPFSTQHGTKGAEYEDVIVILDNGKWNKYNFESALTNNGNNKTRETYNRSLNILYVSLSRARNNLAVLMVKPNSSILSAAHEIFGEDNVIEF
jgi:DNA helicase